MLLCSDVIDVMWDSISFGVGVRVGVEKYESEHVGRWFIIWMSYEIRCVAGRGGVHRLPKTFGWHVR